MSELITVNSYSTRRASMASGMILHESNCNVRRPSPVVRSVCVSVPVHQYDIKNQSRARVEESGSESGGVAVG